MNQTYQPGDVIGLNQHTTGQDDISYVIIAGPRVRNKVYNLLEIRPPNEPWQMSTVEASVIESLYTQRGRIQDFSYRRIAGLNYHQITDIYPQLCDYL